MSPPIISIDQLITPITPAQFKAKWYAILAQLNASTTNWKPGAVVRLYIAAGSIIAAALSISISLLARGGFLTLAEGVWKRLCAYHIFGTLYLSATAATGPVFFTNSGGGNFPKAAYSVTLRGANGKTYRNRDAFTLAPLGTATVYFVADELGTASNAGIGTITQIVTTMPNVTCTNPQAFIARDDETDPELEARALLKPQSLSPNGARGAYDYFARTATRQDGSTIGVNRVTVSPASYFGETTVTVATPAGAVPGSMTDPATDLGAIYQRFQENCLPGGIEVTVNTAVNLPVNVQFNAYYASKVIPPAVQLAVATPAINSYLTSPNMPIGGVVLPNTVSGVVPLATLRDVISQAFVAKGYGLPTFVYITLPAADVPVASSQVPVPGVITSA